METARCAVCGWPTGTPEGCGCVQSKPAVRPINARPPDGMELARRLVKMWDERQIDFPSLVADARALLRRVQSGSDSF